MPIFQTSNQTQRPRRSVRFFSALPGGERAFYGIDKSRLLPGWAPLSAAHDAAFYRNVNAAGLAGVVRRWNERLTPTGRWFAVATVALFLAGANTLDLQAYIPLLYAISIWLAALIFVTGARPKCNLTVQHADRVCAGESFRFTLRVTNTGRRAGHEWRVLPHRLPPQISFAPPGGCSLGQANPKQEVVADLELACMRRGVFQLQGWRVETSFPMGLLNSGTVVESRHRILVFPSFTPLSHLEIPTGRRHHPGGVALASHLGDSFEFLGNRDYREGDNPRDIDWRASGRLQRPIVREYREEYFLRVAVVLDTHLPKLDDQTAQADFEQAVSLCAAAGDFMARQEYLVDIFAAGPNLYHLTAGRSLAYLDQILDILACVDANPQEPFDTLEPEILENLSKINAIICVFLDWNESRREFCRHLAQSGAGVKVVIARSTPCTDDPAAEFDWLGPIPVLSLADGARGVTSL